MERSHRKSKFMDKVYFQNSYRNYKEKVKSLSKSNERDLSATKTRLRCKLFRAFALVLGINVPNQGTFISSRWVLLRLDLIFI